MTGLEGVGQPSEQYNEVLIVVVDVVVEADAEPDADAFGRKVISIAIPITTKINTATAKGADVCSLRGVRDVALKLIWAIQTIRVITGRMLLTLVQKWTFRKRRDSTSFDSSLLLISTHLDSLISTLTSVS
jgi:hypothetical protein